MIYEGDKVRVDIPDRDDPDFNLHREKGTIIDVIEDDASEFTGDERDSKLFRVELETGEIVDVRWRDLRPI
ncbi:hypothetical protein [Natronomonas salina]|uniref:hypothetical protein n=1 Tax=Natronomonas salina TaxID=1710540 RepID=UPI003CCD81A4